LQFTEPVNYKLITYLDGKLYIENLFKLILPDIQLSHLKLHCKTNITDSEIIVFQFKFFKYFYNRHLKNFCSIKFSIKTSQENLKNEFMKGLNKSEYTYSKLIFGDCDLDINFDGIFKLILKEISDPFYIFQLFSVILWFNNNYIKYSIVIIFMTCLSIVISVIETRSSNLSIQKMSKYSCQVKVHRIEDGIKKIFAISSVELVPGDVFELPDDGLALPCDCILVSGIVVVNESMLTGESTCIIKSHIPFTSSIFDPKIEKKYMLYAGTKIVQKRSKGLSNVLAIVSSIGFNTEKGNLVRNILFPKEIKIKFQKDSLKYILFMGTLAIIGFLIVLRYMILYGKTAREIVMKLLDMVTITVPPALPGCLGIGISIALSRLKSWGIMCVNRERINLSGSVNMVCFDKTGTLTEDYLEIEGFRPVKLTQGKAIYDEYLTDCIKLGETSFNYYKEKIKGGKVNKNKELQSLYMESISSCHNITNIKGKLSGDPIDVGMFEKTGWILNENLEKQDSSDMESIRPPQEKDLKDKLASNEIEHDNIVASHYELSIFRKLDFSSKLQRMSVIVKNPNETNFKVFCKGSPEKIKELCKIETIPEDFNDVLSHYTTKGYRVLALSMKFIKVDASKIQSLERDLLESEMVYLGLLVVKNKLKSRTRSSIQTLRDADLKMVMATGDNIFTAIAVAKECELIKSDSILYSCNIEIENNQSNLKWNFVENFLEEEGNNNKNIKYNAIETENLVRISQMSKEESRGYSMFFTPESISDQPRKEGDIELVFQEKKEIEYVSQDHINIDLQNSPFKVENQKDYVIAITGTTFEKMWKLRNKYLTSKNEIYKIYYDTFKLILRNCYIYARMSPEHKAILVDSLREENFTVCMCGDGENDSMALKAADVGVSLSTEEASIAAPFTSKTPDISCLIKLFREGKASLVTSLQTFKYMMIYSLIQFLGCSILVASDSNFSEYQFLTSDLFIILPLAILTSRTSAAKKLTKYFACDDLISFPIISSILLQTLTVLATQAGLWTLLLNQKWYISGTCGYDEDDNPIACMDNTVNF
jgi:cation-transporting ATPase 13A2